MPCVHQDLEHREKFGQGEIRFGKLYNAMVSRPVGRKEMMEDPDAKASMRNEWLGQHKQGVYDFSIVREYDDVVAEAKREGKEVHMARVHGICVEKNYQLPKGSPGCKFKGRGVLLGNQVKNQHWEAAFFQDLGNSPATFEASRWADFYGCIPGHKCEAGRRHSGVHTSEAYGTSLLGRTPRRCMAGRHRHPEVQKTGSATCQSTLWSS